MSDTKNMKSERPLSPHLQIYKPQMTSTLSILHRATGVALGIGTLMVVWLLLSAAIGEAAFAQFMDFATSPPGQFLLLGWSFALFYHMANGVRHLVWDTGRMFNIGCAKKAGMLVLLFAVGMTALTWFLAYSN